MQPFKILSGDFGTPDQPTLVQHSDPIESTLSVWQSRLQISYGPSPAQRFDLLMNTNPNAKAALAFYVHGGGNSIGDSESSDNDPSIGILLNNGYNVVSINYRLESEAPWPAPVQDVVSAMNAADKLFGNQFIVNIAVGDSAGGMDLADALYSSAKNPDGSYKYPTPDRPPDLLVVNSSPLMYPQSASMATDLVGLARTTTPCVGFFGENDPYDFGHGGAGSNPDLFKQYLDKANVPNNIVVLTSPPYTPQETLHLGILVPLLDGSDPRITALYNDTLQAPLKWKGLA